MNNSEEGNIPPPSLSYFNQYDEQTFAEYLEAFCEKVEKKEKENLEKEKKANFFMEEEQENNQIISNIFIPNPPFPSINFFEYKENQQFTGLASTKHLEFNENLSLEILKEEEDQNLCKAEHLNNGCENDVMIDENNPDKLIKHSEDWSVNIFERETRLKQIIISADKIKTQLENSFNFFMQNVVSQ